MERFLHTTNDRFGSSVECLSSAVTLHNHPVSSILKRTISSDNFQLDSEVLQQKNLIESLSNYLPSSHSIVQITLPQTNNQRRTSHLMQRNKSYGSRRQKSEQRSIMNPGPAKNPLSATRNGQGTEQPSKYKAKATS
ncbi:hypothetical protein Tco_1446622 [Tanacetum coccineum]